MPVTSSPVDEIIARVPGAPLLMAQRAFIDSLRAFQTISQSWEASPDSIAQVAGNTAQYDITYNAVDSEPFDLLFTQLPRKEPMAATTREFYRNRAEAPNILSDTTVYSLISFGPNVARIQLMKDPGADKSADLRITMALRQTYDTAGVNPFAHSITDPHFSSYREEVILGAAGRLLMLPNRVWTNIDLGTGLVKLAKTRAEEWSTIRPDGGARTTSRNAVGGYGGY